MILNIFCEKILAINPVRSIILFLHSLLNETNNRMIRIKKSGPLEATQLIISIQGLQSKFNWMFSKANLFY